eukprot:6174567-Pleurochrysis_carterae.AAC.3
MLDCICPHVNQVEGAQGKNAHKLLRRISLLHTAAMKRLYIHDLPLASSHARCAAFPTKERGQDDNCRIPVSR